MTILRGKSLNCEIKSCDYLFTFFNPWRKQASSRHLLWGFQLQLFCDWRVCFSLQAIRPCGCCSVCVPMTWTCRSGTSSTRACWTREEDTRTTAAWCASAKTGSQRVTLPIKQGFLTWKLYVYGLKYNTFILYYIAITVYLKTSSGLQVHLTFSFKICIFIRLLCIGFCLSNGTSEWADAGI